MDSYIMLGIATFMFIMSFMINGFTVPFIRLFSFLSIVVYLMLIIEINNNQYEKIDNAIKKYPSSSLSIDKRKAMKDGKISYAEYVYFYINISRLENNNINL
ncbi:MULTISPECIES: hypothetical protein [Pasteurellaceae]|uniref:Uncharacterized protein n=1 Tax=Pasteurella atlantica TaxID=2827233 RepID=A0AAW8CPC8_9PAST|nr:hypothetical protein [Pasteurella atlantica]MBR0574469.1 hypothetical protein [Pasteurella atlantica]MDP8039346.1 hypothetical protein [Pasteurella atlantica]MDP8041438.1 hypothetical protein [Pasteurella atlantica]MDP8043637.1 hypothetical protein [Pasteurella atlantica]MDP8045659.1 hypothetical protein [Pasteurella atlantica]